MDSVSTLCWVVHSASARDGSSAGGLAAQTLPPRELLPPSSHAHSQVCVHPLPLRWARFGGLKSWGGRGVEQALRCLVSPEGRAEGRAELCAHWCRKDIPGPCFSNPVMFTLVCILSFHIG